MMRVDLTDQLYKDVFLFSPLGIYTLDKDGFITSFNPAMEKMAGDDASQVIGQNAFNFESYKRAGLDQFFRKGLGGETFETKVEYTSKFGKQTTIRHYRGVPIPDDGVEGQARLLLIVEDVTERVNMENAIESLAKFTEENTNPIMRANADGQIILENSAAGPVLSYLRKSDKTQLTQLENAVIDAIKNNQKKSVDIEFKGRTILFELIPQTKSGYVNMYGRDVTEERHSQEIKDHFLSTTSHELRTPMTIIRGYADIMLHDERDPLSPTHREFAEKIKANCGKLIDFVGNMLDLNKLEQGKYEEPSIHDIDAKQVVASIVTSMSDLAKESRISLHYLQEEQPVSVKADKEYLERILTNLITNSIKFTEPGGNIYVTMTTTNKNVEIAVRDTGRGISDEDITKLFQKYSTIDRPRLATIQGSGLGLVICKELVEKMHGTISVSSKVDAGSVFKITLPIA